VVWVCAAQEQAPDIRIRLKALECDPLTKAAQEAPAQWDREHRNAHLEEYLAAGFSRKTDI